MNKQDIVYENRVQQSGTHVNHDLTIEHYYGYDIAIFQLWSELEHGTASYETDPSLIQFLSTKNILHSSLSESESYNGITEFSIQSLQEWNNYRMNSEYVLSIQELTEPKYNLKLGFVYKYLFQNRCICIDKTHLLIKLQRKWRAYLNKFKSPAYLQRREIFG